ncbi:MAG: FAD-binding oxidoreductase [Candidatus Rokubacteria bacterium]|nr:FAD-binding oxidoreductase [Candidatus Rokubacteria bacterium]
MPSPLSQRLAEIVGAPHVLSGAACAPYVIEGRTPELAVFPGAKEEVAAVLAMAADGGVPVTPWGGGTRMGLGAPPAHPGLVLGLGRLARLVEHEPGDLTATVEAGMTVEALQAALGRRGQWLSLDPPEASRATVGGILASNASGPRRHLYGTARDLLIGLTMVLADGTIVRGGGKVVKNVAGYDLPKLVIGSFGTLGVIVEATMKLRPRPDCDRLVIARFGTLGEAGSGVRAVMASDLVPSALELADAEVLRALDGEAGSDGAALLVGVDGLAEQVEWQCAELTRLLKDCGLRDWRLLDGEERDQAWRLLGRMAPAVFPEGSAGMSWGVLPTQVPELMERGGEIARRRGLRAALSAHAGVGMVSAALGAAGAGAQRVAETLGEWRALVNASGGHALVEWAPLAVKERISVWDTPGPAQRIMKQIKAELDPRGILNPGRFVGGI